MLRLTVSLSLVLGCAALGAGVVALPTSVRAAPDAAEDPVAEWQKQWDKAMKDSAKDYMNLAAKFVKNLEASSTYLRRFALRYQPDDEENRKYLGYIKEKQSDGTSKWARYDIIADKLREQSDLADPKKTSYNNDKKSVERQILNRFRGLARKATENGAAKDASADAKWAEKSAMAWERVLELDAGQTEFAKDFDEAHVALKHPKYGGKYVSPFKLQFVKARDERAQLGQKEAQAAIKPLDPCEPDGLFSAAGLKGGGGKSAHFVVNATYGKDVAMRLAGDCEKAMNDLVAIYGFDNAIHDRVSFKINVIAQDEPMYHRILEAGGMKPAEVQRLIDHHMGGTGIRGEYVTQSSGGADADDFCMNCVASLLVAQGAAPAMARADLGSSVRENVDDWLWISMGYDVTKRLLHTTLTTWGTFGRYGEAVEPRPGEDKWVELARRLVQADDDVPLKRLIRLSFAKQEFEKPQPHIKGWAFLQFVFEKDPEKAKRFIWNAFANGTAKAIADIYGSGSGDGDPGATGDGSDVDKAIDKLDAEYREWILKT